MLEIDLKKLIKSYDQNLLDNLRGFGKDNDFLKFWVPSTDDYQSFLNLVDALVETKIFEVKIKISKITNEKVLIDNIETFLLKISQFEKINEETYIIFVIKIDALKYTNFLIKKKNYSEQVKEQDIDKTKIVKIHKSDELIKPLYQKNLNLFNPKDFFLKSTKKNDHVYIQKIETFEMCFEIKRDIIENLSHNIEKNTDLKKMVNIFFELIIYKNIQEAADHGVIYLEEKIRLGKNKETSDGIILPSHAGSYFTHINNAIRNLFLTYKNKTKSKFDINKNYYKVSKNWKILNKEEKIKKINYILNEIFLNNNSLSKKSITVNKIENDFKIFFNVDRNFKELQEKKNLLLEIELKLKILDNTLEVFVEEILDQNKLRLKNSPQNL